MGGKFKAVDKEFDPVKYKPKLIDTESVVALKDKTFNLKDTVDEICEYVPAMYYRDVAKILKLALYFWCIALIEKKTIVLPNFGSIVPVLNPIGKRLINPLTGGFSYLAVPMRIQFRMSRFLQWLSGSDYTLKRDLCSRRKAFARRHADKVKEILYLPKHQEMLNRICAIPFTNQLEKDYYDKACKLKTKAWRFDSLR